MENAINQVVSNFLILHLVGLKEEKFWITLSSHLKFALGHRQSQAGDIHKLSVIITVKLVFTLIVSPCRSYNCKMNPTSAFCCKNGRHTPSHIYAVRNCGILISLILSGL